jgi:conjugal transfer/entry exclusion protein
MKTTTTRCRKQLIVLAAVVAIGMPTAALADIVFDPTNFAEAVDAVEQDVQLVEQFKQQIQNQLAMLQGWGYSQLAGILQEMGVWQQVFGKAGGGGGGGTYASSDPGTTLNQQYPDDPTDYANTTDASIQSMRAGWDQEARSVLVENRTVQDDAYQSLATTAQIVGNDLAESNAAPGQTAAVQAGNEELATLVSQIQTLQAQEITDARGQAERGAQEQAEAAYAQEQKQLVRGDWDNPQPPTETLVSAFPLADE